MAKALVLGGGGVAGIAWETGVLFGLREAGLDLSDADLLVGTSAGSVVATQVATGQGLADLHERQLASHTHERTVEFDVEAMIARFVELLADRPHPEELRRRIGEWALLADTVPEDERLVIIDSRLPVQDVAGAGVAGHGGRRRHRRLRRVRPRLGCRPGRGRRRQLRRAGGVAARSPSATVATSTGVCAPPSTLTSPTATSRW